MSKELDVDCPACGENVVPIKYFTADYKSEVWECPQCESLARMEEWTEHEEDDDAES